MNALYNEIDPFAAGWLRELAARGHIAAGRVDERSITDLKPADVAGHGQRHFFAGIGGWSYALRLAGVPDDADVWTGSCPCQPFSDAGKGLGVRDPRHLWPTWFGLIRECRPSVVFGEQVASRAGLSWLDAVFADLEGCGYAVGAADLCSASVGGPHIRQRIYFVAHSAAPGPQGGTWIERARSGRLSVEPASRGDLGGLGDANSERNADGRSRSSAQAPGRVRGQAREQRIRLNARQPSHADRSICEWIPCADGVSRPVEPGTFPLAHGLPARVGRLRGYGNAIDPELAATFISSALDAIEEG